MSIEAMKLAAEFSRYFTSGNGVDVPAKVSVSRDEWRALFAAIQQATQAEVTDSMIREAFLANGFTIKEGHNDLKPYVYAAARAILALRPVQVPMTEDQVWHNDALMSANGTAGFKMDALMRIVRAAEAHHGITAQAKKEDA